MQEDFFPFDKVEKGSKVILYGAGYNAKKIIKINEETDWCQIIACADRGYRHIIDFPKPVYAPGEIIAKTEFDYILVTLIDEYQRKQITKTLTGMGVPVEKIIDSFLKPEKRILYLHHEDDSCKLKIGFHPMGVIGDCIISLKVYQELVRMADEKCEIDVLNEFNARFMDSIFFNQKCLRKIVDGNSEIKKEDLERYDLVVDVRFEPSIVSCDLNRLEQISPKLAAAMKILIEYQENDYVDIPIFQYTNRILLDRAKFLGLNRYTLFNISGAFDIKDNKVDFYIDDSYELDFSGLGLGKPYITFNFGANDQYKDGSRQTKMWPYEYHARLNQLLKESYPDIEILQLGSANVEKVPGADRYVLGQALDVVKYVLEKAIFHFDCEGGLVHMASQIGTKCFVVFGPTPAWFLGYKNNENILPEKCGSCKGLIKNWYTRCLLYDRPECMYSITPEKVFEKMKVYLESMGYFSKRVGN